MRGDPPSDVYRTSAVHIQQHETIEFLKIGDPPSDVKSIDPQSDPPCDVYVTRGRGHSNMLWKVSSYSSKA